MSVGGFGSLNVSLMQPRYAPFLIQMVANMCQSLEEYALFPIPLDVNICQSLRRIYFIFHPGGQKHTLITKKNILHFPSPWMQKNVPILQNRVSFFGFLFPFFVRLTVLAWRRCFGQMESNSFLKDQMTCIIHLKLRKCLRWVSCPCSDF